MAKNAKKSNEVVSNETAVEAVVVTHIVPIDGSGATAYIAEQGGVSKAIRALTAAGYSRGDVAKMLNKRYQHVRNVLITPVKRVETNKEPTEQQG